MIQVSGLLGFSLTALGWQTQLHTPSLFRTESAHCLHVHSLNGRNMFVDTPNKLWRKQLVYNKTITAKDVTGLGPEHPFGTNLQVVNRSDIEWWETLSVWCWR